jgi:hypothetical protein
MLTKDDVTMLVFAYRYAIGRKTYAPGLVCDYITSKIPEMSEQQIKEVINEVTKTLEHGDYADSIALDEVNKLFCRLRRGNIMVRDWFTDVDGEHAWALVVHNNRYCYWGCKIKDVFPDSQDFYDGCDQGSKLLLNKILRDGFDPAKLPHIEDADPVMQQLWRNITESDNNMWFIDEPAYSSDTEEDMVWAYDFGITRDEYERRMDAAIKKYHLEDVITKCEDESTMYTCYGDLQSMFSGPLHE